MSAQVLSWQRVKQLPAPVWLLLWGNFFVRGSYFMVWPFLAVILYQRYDLSATETGFWLTSAALLAVVAGFYAGHLSDRFGRKPLMLAGALTGVLAFSALALADTLQLMLCCIFLATLPRALWDAPSKAWLGDLLPDSKDRELALQGLYFMVNAGAACGPVLGLWAGLSGNPHGFFITAASYGALGLGLLWYAASVLGSRLTPPWPWTATSRCSLATSTPTSRKAECIWRMTSGRVIQRYSLQPSRLAPPKSSGPRSRS